MKKIKIKPSINMEEVNAAIKKTKKLKSLLKEVKELLRTLSA